jgi:hypothetical protein
VIIKLNVYEYLKFEISFSGTKEALILYVCTHIMLKDYKKQVIHSARLILQFAAPKFKKNAVILKLDWLT